ncbi:MAG: hypothetical protein BGP12_14775 [Rhodospirillales bacterium 70-18]|nr:GntR family transcriptional regulator [Rhodospirillales bacterium]OJY67393.1 MAG: hypothetical protein BGP12_14775 [Rhodospirillales bacterium 70-18]
MTRPALTALLNRASGPLYRQAAQHLRQAITGGRLKLGAELPTEAVLAEGFGVSLITIRAALRELEGEGLIRKRAAKTAVVAGTQPRGQPDTAMARQVNSLDDIVAATDGARLEIASYRPARSAEAAREFGLDGRGMLPCLRGRLLRGGAPLAAFTIFFPPDIGRQLKRADFDDVVVFRSVERRLGIRIAGARITVGAQLADPALAALLDCDEGAPVLASRTVYRDTAGAPVEVTLTRHRGDNYSMSYEVPAR